MCGIVGYVGPRRAQEVLLGGLHRLEYRGYDSAGVATIENDRVEVTRTAGRVSDLEASIDSGSHGGRIGIGHTRWATHGAPTTENAHPHVDCSGGLAVAHNGIIENHAALRDELTASGHRFTSGTDTEVICHLIEDQGDVPLGEAVREAMKRAEGALAIAVVRGSDPDLIVAARRSSPLVLGRGEGENFVASDIPAILEHTRQIVIVEDDRVAEIGSKELRVTDLEGEVVDAPAQEVEWDLEAAEKSGFPDFMLKEIHEQPAAIADTLRGRIGPGGRIELDELDLGDVRRFDKVFVVAAGTSYHAAMMAKYAIERWTRMPVEIDIASEFRYRDPVLDEKTLLIGISQSGETLDTMAAMRHGRAQGAATLAVSNAVGSSMARESQAVLYTRAGPEIGVAATKTFATQLVAMLLLGLWLAQHRATLDDATVGEIVATVEDLPSQVGQVLESSDQIKQIASGWSDVRDFFFLGRGGAFPVAMEGALKLKEIAYVRAEGYAAGEMKHGPIALIEAGVVVVGVAPSGHLAAKTLSNMEEIKARGGTVALVLSEGDVEGRRLADEVLWVPPAPELVNSVVSVIPLQLLAYWIAKGKAVDVDKPRNLAKTVTVE